MGKSALSTKNANSVGSPKKAKSKDAKKEAKKEERAAELAKQKAVKDALITANSFDPFAKFAMFQSYSRNGLDAAVQRLTAESSMGPAASEFARTHLGSDMEARLKLEETHTFVAEANGKVLGLVALQYRMEEELPVAVLELLVVDPESRSKGLGKHLLQLVELTARSTGLAGVWVPIPANHSEAVMPFLEKLKYQMSDTSPARTNPLQENSKLEYMCKISDPDARAQLASRGARARELWLQKERKNEGSDMFEGCGSKFSESPSTV